MPATGGRTAKEIYLKTRDVCQSMHKVAKAADLYPSGYKKCVLKCRLNPMRLLCTCKGSRHHGICSHILAYTHLMGKIDIDVQLGALCPRRAAGRPKGAKPRDQMQPDEAEGLEESDEDDPTEQNLDGV